MDEDRHLLSTAAGAAITCATIYAFFNAPLLRFANARDLGTWGAVMAVGAASLWVTVLLEQGKRFRWGAMVLFFLGMGGILVITIQTLRKAEINEVRCKSLQDDMFSPKPRRADGAAIFQALGCSGQGDLVVQFPASTSNEGAVVTGRASIGLVPAKAK